MIANHVVIGGVDYGELVNVDDHFLVDGVFVDKFYADSLGLKYSPYGGEEFIRDIYVSVSTNGRNNIHFYGTEVDELEPIARRLTSSGKYTATICTNTRIFQWWENGSLAKGTRDLISDYEGECNYY